MNPQTILTGDRPTGPLHLGHFVGSLRQRVALQQTHNQFVLIADLQGLTDNGSNPQKIRDNIPEVLADYLAAGIDPNQTTICLQSALPALAELTMLYMNIVTVARVERNPTVKNEIVQKGFARSLPVGFMAYPISQAADITAFKAECVPVGDDQLPMIEQTNEIVHKMNSLLPAPVLRHCKAMLSDTSRLPGIDGGAKMSKSLGNFFTVRDVLKYYDAETVRYFLMSGHYRSQLNYSEENLKQARAALERLYTALRGTDKSVPAAGGEAFEARFVEVMNDDFNTPEAYSVLFDMAREVNRLKSEDMAAANALASHLRKLSSVLGLLEQEPDLFLQSGAQADDGEVAEIEALIKARLEARQAKDWAAADAARNRLTEMGIILEDGPQGTTWRRK